MLARTQRFPLTIVAAIVTLCASASWSSSSHRWAYLGGTQISGPAKIDGDSASQGTWGFDCGTRIDQRCVTNAASGAWAEYKNVDLRCGLTGIDFKAGSNDGAKVVVRLDSLSATPLCTLDIPRATVSAAPSVYSVRLAQSTSSGIHNVWFSFQGWVDQAIWIQFSTSCPPTASLDTNWLPRGAPVTGDTVNFVSLTRAESLATDTVGWDLDIAPSSVNIVSGRNLRVRFNPLAERGVDTLHIQGNLRLSAGHLVLPAGFVLSVASADTNGVALPVGVYDSLIVKAGIVRQASVTGGGTLIVGSEVGARTPRVRVNPAFDRISPIVRQGSIVVNVKVVDCIELYGADGSVVRRARAANAISTMDVVSGIYVLRAQGSGWKRQWSVCIGIAR